jgi:hypothetical protein
LADAACCEWIHAQPWFHDKFAAVFAVIVNGGVVPDADTPEHNKMQVLFLDVEMCLAVVRLRQRVIWWWPTSQGLRP